MGLEGERERESVKADHSRAEEGSGGPRARGSLDDPHMPGGKEERDSTCTHTPGKEGRKRGGPAKETSTTSKCVRSAAKLRGRSASRRLALNTTWLSCLQALQP